MQGFNRYDLLKGIHYLGYHTYETMRYSFETTRPFTLVTSNVKEVKECVDEYKGRTYIWVIVAGEDKYGQSAYLLREVFKPHDYEPAHPGHYAGAKKTFKLAIDGKDEGYELGEGIDLKQFSWFNKFFEENGRFGFGLRLLKDEAVKAEFIRLAEPFIRPV